MKKRLWTFKKLHENKKLCIVNYNFYQIYVDHYNSWVSNIKIILNKSMYRVNKGKFRDIMVICNKSYIVIVGKFYWACWISLKKLSSNKDCKLQSCAVIVGWNLQKDKISIVLYCANAPDWRKENKWSWLYVYLHANVTTSEGDCS